MTVVAFNGVVSSVLSWAEDQGMQLTGPMTEAINQDRSDKYEYTPAGQHAAQPWRTLWVISAVISICVCTNTNIVLCICHSSCDLVTLIFRGPSFGSQVINW